MWDANKDRVVSGLMARNALLDTNRRNKFIFGDFDYRKHYESWKCHDDRKDKAFWYLSAIIDNYFPINYAFKCLESLWRNITKKSKIKSPNYTRGSIYDYQAKYHLDNAIIGIYSCFELMAVVFSIHFNWLDVPQAKNSKIGSFINAANRHIKTYSFERRQRNQIMIFLLHYNSKQFEDLEKYRTVELHYHKNRLAVFLPRMNGKDLFLEDILNTAAEGYELFEKCYDLLLNILNTIDTTSFRRY